METTHILLAILNIIAILIVATVKIKRAKLKYAELVKYNADLAVYETYQDHSDEIYKHPNYFLLTTKPTKPDLSDNPTAFSIIGIILGIFTAVTSIETGGSITVVLILTTLSVTVFLIDFISLSVWWGASDTKLTVYKKPPELHIIDIIRTRLDVATVLENFTGRMLISHEESITHDNDAVGFRTRPLRPEVLSVVSYENKGEMFSFQIDMESQFFVHLFKSDVMEMFPDSKDLLPVYAEKMAGGMLNNIKITALDYDLCIDIEPIFAESSPLSVMPYGLTHVSSTVDLSFVNIFKRIQDLVVRLDYGNYLDMAALGGLEIIDSAAVFSTSKHYKIAYRKVGDMHL